MLDFKAHKYTQGHPYNLMTNKGKKTIVYISVVVLLTYEVNINQVWLKRNVFTYAPESNCYGSYQTPELQKKERQVLPTFLSKSGNSFCQSSLCPKKYEYLACPLPAPPLVLIFYASDLFCPIQ